MSAELLRKAATILRERAEACDPWQGSDDFGSWADEYASDGGNGTDAAYIRVMHPGVGLALADWLDLHAAFAADEGFGADDQAFTIARLIVGGDA